MKKAFYYTAVLICIISGCQSKPADIHQLFSEREPPLTEIIGQLRADTAFRHKYGTTFPVTQFPPSIRVKLHKLGIDSVFVFSWGEKTPQFVFITNWQKTPPIHLWYNSLDSIDTRKGAYRKDENNNEVWGKGNNWAMISAVKLIDAVQ